MAIPVILSGGSGTRLWPYSRSMYPKQFLPLVSEQTMVQETVSRLNQFSALSIESPVVICNEEHRFMVAEQLRAIDCAPSQIILEPFGRNTAPAIALAALANPEAILLVLPADHVIKNIAAFEAAVAKAEVQAEQGQLVTFGIVPTAPETGYGYVKAGNSVADSVNVVAEFVEKPDKATAESYLASGDYFWNSGMFMFKASRYLEELKKFNAEMLEVCESSLKDAKSDLDFTRIDADTFACEVHPKK